MNELTVSMRIERASKTVSNAFHPRYRNYSLNEIIVQTIAEILSKSYAQ